MSNADDWDFSAFDEETYQPQQTTYSSGGALAEANGAPIGDAAAAVDDFGFFSEFTEEPIGISSSLGVQHAKENTAESSGDVFAVPAVGTAGGFDDTDDMDFGMVSPNGNGADGLTAEFVEEGGSDPSTNAHGTLSGGTSALHTSSATPLPLGLNDSHSSSLHVTTTTGENNEAGGDDDDMFAFPSIASPFADSQANGSHHTLHFGGEGAPREDAAASAAVTTNAIAQQQSTSPLHSSGSNPIVHVGIAEGDDDAEDEGDFFFAGALSTPAGTMPSVTSGGTRVGTTPPTTFALPPPDRVTSANADDDDFNFLHNDGSRRVTFHSGSSSSAHPHPQLRQPPPLPPPISQQRQHFPTTASSLASLQPPQQQREEPSYTYGSLQIRRQRQQAAAAMSRHAAGGRGNIFLPPLPSAGASATSTDTVVRTSQQASRHHHDAAADDDDDEGPVDERRVIRRVEERRRLQHLLDSNEATLAAVRAEKARLISRRLQCIALADVIAAEVIYALSAAATTSALPADHSPQQLMAALEARGAAGSGSGGIASAASQLSMLVSTDTKVTALLIAAGDAALAAADPKKGRRKVASKSDDDGMVDAASSSDEGDFQEEEETTPVTPPSAVDGEYPTDTDAMAAAGGGKEDGEGGGGETIASVGDKRERAAAAAEGLSSATLKRAKKRSANVPPLSSEPNAAAPFGMSAKGKPLLSKRRVRFTGDATTMSTAQRRATAQRGPRGCRGLEPASSCEDNVIMLKTSYVRDPFTWYNRDPPLSQEGIEVLCLERLFPKPSYTTRRRRIGWGPQSDMMLRLLVTCLALDGGDGDGVGGVGARAPAALLTASQQRTFSNNSNNNVGSHHHHHGGDGGEAAGSRMRSTTNSSGTSGGGGAANALVSNTNSPMLAAVPHPNNLPLGPQATTASHHDPYHLQQKHVLDASFEALMTEFPTSRREDFELLARQPRGVRWTYVRDLLERMPAGRGGSGTFLKPEPGEESVSFRTYVPLSPLEVECRYYNAVRCGGPSSLRCDDFTPAEDTVLFDCMTVLDRAAGRAVFVGYTRPFTDSDGRAVGRPHARHNPWLEVAARLPGRSPFACVQRFQLYINQDFVTRRLAPSSDAHNALCRVVRIIGPANALAVTQLTNAVLDTLYEREIGVHRRRTVGIGLRHRECDRSRSLLNARAAGTGASASPQYHGSSLSPYVGPAGHKASGANHSCSRSQASAAPQLSPVAGRSPTDSKGHRSGGRTATSGSTSVRVGDGYGELRADVMERLFGHPSDEKGGGPFVGYSRSPANNGGSPADFPTPANGPRAADAAGAGSGGALSCSPGNTSHTHTHSHHTSDAGAHGGGGGEGGGPPEDGNAHQSQQQSGAPPIMNASSSSSSGSPTPYELPHHLREGAAPYQCAFRTVGFVSVSVVKSFIQRMRDDPRHDSAQHAAEGTALTAAASSDVLRAITRGYTAEAQWLAIFTTAATHIVRGAPQSAASRHFAFKAYCFALRMMRRWRAAQRQRLLRSGSVDSNNNNEAREGTAARSRSLLRSPMTPNTRHPSADDGFPLVGSPPATPNTHHHRVEAPNNSSAATEGGAAVGGSFPADVVPPVFEVPPFVSAAFNGGVAEPSVAQQLTARHFLQLNAIVASQTKNIAGWVALPKDKEGEAEGRAAKRRGRRTETAEGAPAAPAVANRARPPALVASTKTATPQLEGSRISARVGASSIGKAPAYPAGKITLSLGRPMLGRPAAAAAPLPMPLNANALASTSAISSSSATPSHHPLASPPFNPLVTNPPSLVASPSTRMDFAFPSVPPPQ